MRVLRFIALLTLTLSLPLSALAIDLGGGALQDAGDGAGINTSGTEGSLATLVGSIIGVVLSILGVLLFVLFVYAGVLWMTAQGDEKAIKKAKDIMGNALIGLIITLVANSIVFFVSARLPGGTTIWTQSTSDAEGAAGLTGTNILIEENIGLVINVVLNSLGVVLLLLFIYAGILWMTAQGDEKAIKKAKDIMRNALVGLIIVLLSRAIALFVVDSLASSSSEVTAFERAVQVRYWIS